MKLQMYDIYQVVFSKSIVQLSDFDKNLDSLYSEKHWMIPSRKGHPHCTQSIYTGHISC